MWTNVQINQIVSKQDLVKHSSDEDGVGRRASVRCQEILMNGCGNIRHVTALDPRFCFCFAFFTEMD